MLTQPLPQTMPTRRFVELAVGAEASGGRGAVPSGTRCPLGEIPRVGWQNSIMHRARHPPEAGSDPAHSIKVETCLSKVAIYFGSWACLLLAVGRGVNPSPKGKGRVQNQSSILSHPAHKGLVGFVGPARRFREAYSIFPCILAPYFRCSHCAARSMWTLIIMRMFFDKSNIR